jgi:predicted CXXCH cytochrome family protein
MGRSFYKARAANMVEDFLRRNTLYNRASDRYYTMMARGSEWVERRHQIGFDGKEANVVEAAIDYVIGSGNHARSYLHRAASGSLVELPVSWYTEKGGYWEMSPGYDRADQQDFRRVIGSDCLFCHNGYPRGELAEGIDCQRCHGPGSRHADLAGSGKARAEEIRRAIVNPKRLGRERQLDVCMQCHLETTSRPLPHVIERYEHGAFTYRPGEALGDYFIHFDRAGAASEDRFEIAHAGYRLRRSACFLKSQMTCTTCHDPHNVPRGAEAVRQYVAVCKSCHAGAHRASEDCVECHMPSRRTDDAVHVVMTDHWIRRRAEGTGATGFTDHEKRWSVPLEVVAYYPVRAEELYLALAQVQDGANLEAGIPRLKAAIEKAGAACRAEFYFELGRAYVNAGRPEDAVPWFEEALRRGYGAAREELGAALVAAGQYQRAVEALQGSNGPAAKSNLGNALLRLGRLDEAQRVLEGVDAPEALNLSGLVLVARGDRASAERAFREAIRLQPDLAAARANLGNLLAARRAYREAAFHYQRAVASDAGNAETHYRYGLALMLSGDNRKAIEELQTTVQLDPKRADAREDLAELLKSMR